MSDPQPYIVTPDVNARLDLRSDDHSLHDVPLQPISAITSSAPLMLPPSARVLEAGSNLHPNASAIESCVLLVFCQEAGENTKTREFAMGKFFKGRSYSVSH